MRHVLLIGSGRRIRENFLPALDCLGGDFDVIGIHSRTSEHYRRVAADHGIDPVDAVDDVILSRTDVVIISAPPHVWVEFLPKLMAHASRLTLVVDTPLRLFHPGLLAKLGRFARVLATEDYPGFPRFDLLREFCASGAIGAIREVRLLGDGYRYHGTSLIRSFFGFAAPFLIRSQRISHDTVHLDLTFPGGTKGGIREPYVAELGHVEIRGERGSVTDGDIGGFSHRLIAVRDTDGVSAFEVRAGDRLFRRELVHRQALLRYPKHDDFEIEKTHGLIMLLESIVRPNIYSAYGFGEALYEEWLSETPRIASCIIIDPFTALGMKPFRARWYWTFLRAVKLCVRLKGRVTRLMKK